MDARSRSGSRSRSQRARVAVVAGLVVAAATVGLAGCGSDDDTVTVTHGPVPAPVLIDLGDEGPSVGDQRIFHFEAASGDTKVMTDWIMTTTAIDSPDASVETRMTSAVFLFGDLDDSLVLQGTGWYPGEGATLEVSATLVRAIIGGTGRYEGATGHVESTRNPDDTWVHVFHID